MSRPPRLLQNGKMPLAALDQELAAQFDIHRLDLEADRAGFLAAHGAEFVGLVTSAGIGADAELVRALPNLQVVSSFGVGYDTLDEAALVAQKVRVGHTPQVLDGCVADLAFALLLDVSRGVSAADRFVRRGDWTRGRFGLQTRVSGKRLGIFGMGRIGSTIARRGSGFDMEVGYHNRRPVEGSPHAYKDSLLALAEWCDYLVVAAAGGAGTRHLVTAEVLDALGPKGFLVNIARGSVVDEAALVQALQQGRIAGAGLDVFEDEPRPLPALLELDNVVLAPHMASGTHETRRAMGDLVVENLKAFFATGRPRAEVPWSAEL
ncbi:2-hydroxyacid dehydrogenase [Comamonas endophytica]|uniref:2-hydroxyacid dehydrogenase n=1 Tax=Comamonas endophytica TaxID=2949090 RepID=A0ABY6GDG5_9BURK|nr:MULTISPECIES: 2-hydroxyacid dehydrogenase [unclassified Acidovorax]MCD2512505.1 2-hydroxyacid dehydrogenase [Acidovorax sp. D4N7]UYG53129.1 2-hydroxyacid dehydrogenase [Acidovorax sp. 5MLIR]